MNSVSKIRLMELNKDFITNENSKKLLDSNILSIKSSEGIRLTTNELGESKNSRNYQFIETNDIRRKKEENSIIIGVSISINRFEEHKWFGPNYYELL